MSLLNECVNISNKYDEILSVEDLSIGLKHCPFVIVGVHVTSHVIPHYRFYLKWPGNNRLLVM